MPVEKVDEMDDRSDAQDFLVGDSEMAMLMRQKDWAQTALGPVENWPQSLKIVVRIMLTSRYAMWMGWGQGLTFFYNDAYQPTLGVKHPWALGTSASDVWAEIWPEIGPRIETVLHTGKATWDEALLLFLKRSGYPEETYHTFSYSPLADDDGAVSGWLCVVTEETERVIGERRLALLRNVAAALAPTQTQADVFDAIREVLEADQHDLPFTLLYLFSPEGTTAELACVSGVPKASPIAVPVVPVSDSTSPWNLEAILSSAASNPVQNLTTLFDELPVGPWDIPAEEALVVPLAQQGQERPAGFLIAGINPYRKLDQEYTGFIGLLAGQIAAALASARAYEDERRRAEALAELDRAKTTFFSNVSHELRTPLTLMLGPVNDMLEQEEKFEAEVHENLTLIQRNGNRLLRLVNTLLDFSRIEAGRVQATYEPVDLAAFTAELASVFRSAIEKAGLTLTVKCQTLPEPVYVNRDMWEKIVLNLVSNAFKFTFSGEIAVSLSAKKGNVQLQVRDSGIGIPEHELPRLFERFRRVEGAKGRTYEGTGIGLALVQELVRLHGGTVTVESQVGQGTIFTVILPFGANHLPAERIVETGTGVRWRSGVREWEAEVSLFQGVPSATIQSLPDIPHSNPADHTNERVTWDLQHRILLADDNADMREYVKRLLQGQYEVETVANGDEALNAVRRQRPSLVLSDVMMPGLDGFGLLRAIRDDAQLKTLPVVLLSARAGEEARVEGLEVGADDYLIKPFSARELLAVIKSQLTLAQVRQEAESELRDIRARLEAALSAGEIGTWTWDIPNDRVYADKNLARMFAITPQEAAGGPIATYYRSVHPDDVERVGEILDNALSRENGIEIELRVIAVPTAPRWMIARGRVERDEQGRPLWLNGVVLDITERKLAEEALRERQLEVETLNVRLQRAMRETHHRVKNNLQLTAAMVDMQAMEENRTPTAEDFKHLGSQIRTLAAVHDLLTKQTTEDGEIGVISARAVLIRLLTMLQQGAQGNTLTYELEDCELPGRQANSLALLTNELVSNAMKHGNGAVEVRLSVSGQNAELAVRDNGSGFPADFDSGTAAHIGLTIVESLAQMDLNGTIYYDNHPQGGALARVIFPLSASV